MEYSITKQHINIDIIGTKRKCLWEWQMIQYRQTNKHTQKKNGRSSQQQKIDNINKGKKNRRVLSQLIFNILFYFTL